MMAACCGAGLIAYLATLFVVGLRMHHVKPI